MELGLKYIDLKNNCKKEIQEGFLKESLAIVADSSTQHLTIALKGYAYLEKINLDIYESGYDQINAQLMDSDSDVYKFNPNIILLFMCSEKMRMKFYSLPIQKRASFADDEIVNICTYWDLIKANSKAKIIQYNFNILNDQIFGSYGLKNEESYIYQITKLNLKLYEKACEYKNVYLVDINNIQSNLGKECFVDEKMYHAAKMVFSIKALPYIAKYTIDVVKALKGLIKKCIVLDLDNTLWGGVIGDDGIENIQIGSLGIGQAFSSFQHWLKELKNRGIILAVCSKNNEDVVKNVFVNHKDMVLKLEDISMFVANWEDKASNIMNIQKTLNIGMDSIVFIDDNPFERSAVKSLIPSLCVPQMPEDPSLYVDYLESLNLFETATYSVEDLNRAAQYTIEAERTSLQKKFSNYNDYLKSLNMQATCSEFDDYYIPRIAQLSQRSNQFNLRTIRYTEEDVNNICKSHDYITRYFCLKDKLGDYGLIAVLVLKKGEDYLFIENLLMSCRVLKRGMEEYIFNSIVNIAKDCGYTKIVGEYIKTEKNALVENLLENMGFKKINDKYILETKDYIIKENYIED